MVVRREKVVLELEDQYTAPILRAAAATNVLNREINDLSGNAVRGQRSTNALERDIDKVGKSTEKSSKEIDQYSGRLRILGEVLAVLGPSAIPISAVAIPAVSGLTSMLGFLATGIGASAFAFKGLGDVMDAVSKARLDPTQKNLDDLRQVMAGLTPETRAFVTELRSFLPILDELQGTAAAGLFPGLGRGLQEAKQAIPELEAVISAITTKVGEVAADAGKSLADGDWDAFFAFIGTEGPKALGKMASAAGNLAHGLAGLWMSTQPLNNDFLNWLVKATDRFDTWSNELGNSKGFHDFVAYVESIGPQVGETLGAIGNALVQVVEAVAPLGGPSLRILEAVANAIAAIADSPIGTPLLGLVSAMSALKLATRGVDLVQSKTFGSPAVTRLKETKNALLEVTTAQQRATMSSKGLAEMEAKRSQTIRSGLGSLAKTTAGIAGLALVSSGAADSIGLTNTASMALAGSFAGPWGAAIGAGVGAVEDFTAAQARAAAQAEALAATLNQQTGAITEATKATVFNTLVENGDIELAKQLGVSLQTVTDAALGNEAAFEAVQKSFSDYVDGAGQGALNVDRAFRQTSASMGGHLLLNDLKDQNGALADARSLWKDRSKALGESASRESTAANATAAMTARAREQVAALNAARTAGQQVNQTFRNYGNTMGDTKKSLDEFIRDFQNKAKALANFGTNSQTALDRGIDPKVVEWLRSEGPEGALRLQQLAKGSKAEIEKMNRSWRQFAVAGRDNVKAGLNVERQIQRTKQAARDATAKRFMFQLGANVDPALLALARLRADVASMHLNVKVTATTNATLADTGSDGATVPKTGLPYADRHLYLLADGERVISNRYGQADRHAPLLDAINNDRRLADGGTVGPPRSGLYKYVTTELDLKFPRTLKQWEHALELSKKSIEKEKAARDDLVSKRNDLRDSVAVGFTSDIFGGDRPSNWQYFSEKDRTSYLTKNPLDVLNKDTANANQFDGILKALAAPGKGLNGPLFEALARSNDIDQAKAFLSLSSGEITKYEKAYADRTRATSAVGSFAGSVVYSKQIDQTNEHLKYMQHQNHDLQVKVTKLEHAVKKAAHDHAKAVNKGRKGHQDDLIQQLANG